MESKLKLPIGIQTFEKLRNEKCVYVDKTKYLIDLIDKGSVYFLARPRRFGKSLTISTFEALFSGKKEHFKGLYAEEFLNRPDFKSNPVILLDMSNITTDCGIDVFKESLKQNTLKVAKELDVEVETRNSAGDILNELIFNTAKKYNNQVVFLLDEYDKPYTDFVNDKEMAEKIRNALRDYYVQIKANDRYIRFTFITGISKFAKFGVFSALNSPHDISMMPEYAEICGLKEEEIIQYFPDYLKETANHLKISTDKLIEEMRYYYNGFSFDSEALARLYNPFSTLAFFRDREFSNYWMETGRSKVIADYLKTKNLTVEQFRNLSINKGFARSPGDMDNTSPEGFLYQCGYLTLRPGTDNELSLDYPNNEVLNAISNILTQNILCENTNSYQTNLLSALNNTSTDKLIKVFNSLLASIPYDDYAKNIEKYLELKDSKLPANEWLYRSMLLAFLRGCGVDVIAEMHTNLGRSDLVINYKGKTWVIELKVAYKGQSPALKAAEALQQIKNMNYADPFPDAICVGLAIEDAVRKITEYKM